MGGPAREGNFEGFGPVGGWVVRGVGGGGAGGGVEVLGDGVDPVVFELVA